MQLAYLMGFDPDKIPIVSQAFRCRNLPLADHGWRDIVVHSNAAAWNRLLADILSTDTFHFEPHFGWKGHIEQSSATAVSADQINEAVRQPLVIPFSPSKFIPACRSSCRMLPAGTTDKKRRGCASGLRSRSDCRN